MNTNRLQIRQLMPEDWRAMRWIAADFRRSEYAIYDMPLPTEEEPIQALTRQFSGSKWFFAVLLEESMIGYICFHEDNGNYDLGYCFHSAYHGKGYAYESCSAMMDDIARTHAVKAFTAGTALKNIPSCNLLNKLGFVLKKTETLAFHKDENGNDITFEGGIYHKEIPMFRELIRKQKQLSQDECIEVLKTETRGVLSVLGDGDYPYGTPMNHFYNDSDGNIYFHCGNLGHRLDALRKHDKVSFCTYDQGYRNEGEWAWNVRSVIVFGRIELIDDLSVIADITAKLSLKFTQDTEYIQKEIEEHAHRTLLLKLTPEHICGKLVNES